MKTYCYLRLRGPGRDTYELKKRLAVVSKDAWLSSGVELWGIWEGLFGIASNELLVVAAADGNRSATDFTQVLGRSGTPVMVADQLLMAATVRPDPNVFEPRSQPGLYVFRFFQVVEEDVDEIAGLSEHAWETFENMDAYAAEPQGLFRPVFREEEEGRMLLVTWYDGFRSWEISRRPPPEAVANFQRRRELTRGTVALAARLLEPLS